MEIIQGKKLWEFDSTDLAARMAGCQDVLIDLGTGDGHFVLDAARRQPGLFAIGVDACRENLREASRKAPPNSLFVIANACALPEALVGLAAQVTINFPWGSLRDGLLDGDPALLDGLARITRPSAHIMVRLNASALAERGWSLDAGGAQARRALELAGFQTSLPRPMDAAALRACASSWARRLASGSGAQAVCVEGERLCLIDFPAQRSAPGYLRVQTANSSTAAV